MKSRLKTIALGIGIVSASVLVHPMLENRNDLHRSRAAKVAQTPDLAHRLLSRDRDARLAAAREIANVPWKRHVAKQAEGAIEPLLNNLKDQDAESRIVYAIGLRRIAEKLPSRKLSESRPVIINALEKEKDPAAKNELKKLDSQMRQSQERAGAFY